MKVQYLVIGAALALYLWNKNKTGCQCGGHN